MTPEINEIDNWYKHKILGSGGFGIVSLWTNKASNISIALKILRLQGSNNKIKSIYIERWAKEVDIMQRLSHPNVVSAKTVPGELLCLSPEYPILCMEYCEKGDLRKVLNDPENCSGLPEVIVRKVLKNIKDAIEYLHNLNITHRDLKPENIVMKETNNEVIFKLIDLGYAKELDQNSLCSSFVGTLQYVAPELFTQNYTNSVDYWSLGLVCHEIITGFRPFLPNMTPYTWMPLVQKKSLDDICIFQNEDESIEYSKSLSSENHICQTLRCLLEDWLKLALEWNGKKRGRDLKKQLIIFSQLDSVLDKKSAEVLKNSKIFKRLYEKLRPRVDHPTKINNAVCDYSQDGSTFSFNLIITVFSSVTLQLLSYEVDGSTAVSTLKDWIKRDVKIAVHEQLLLLPTGEKVPEDHLVSQFWDPSNQVAMIYMFHTNGLELPNCEAKFPPLVKDMMDNPRSPHKYHFLRKMWTSAVFFVQKEVFTCQAFMEAYAVKLLSVILCNQQLTALDQTVNNDLQQLIANINFYTGSLDYDIKCWKSVGIQSSGAPGPEQWKKDEELYKNELLQLQQIGERLGYKISTASAKLSKIQSFIDTYQSPLDQLKKLLDMAYTVYKSLQRRPKELRNSKAESVDLSMLKIIKKSIVERDSLYTDQAFSNHLGDVKRCEIEILSVFAPLKSFKQHINKVKSDLRKSQLQKQKNIWQLLVDLKQNGTREPPTNFSDSNHANPINSTTQNVVKNNLALSRSKSFQDNNYLRYHSSLYLYKQGPNKDNGYVNTSNITNYKVHKL